MVNDGVVGEKKQKLVKNGKVREVTKEYVM